MKRGLVLVGLGLLMLVALPNRATAATLHYMDCKECHKSGMAITSMGANNTCLECHSRGATKTDSTPVPHANYDGNPGGRFTPEDSSDRFGSATAALGSVSSKTSHSHAWGVADVRTEAGAQAPNRTLYAGFYSRYNASTGRVTCSRCHNPHGDADIGDSNPLANPKLLIRDATLANAPMNIEKMCRACHVALDQTDSLVVNTHPIVTDYATAQLVSPNDLRTVAEIATFTTGHQSMAQLSNGGVGCVSCHGVHYVDSDATTQDSKTGVPVNDRVDLGGENYECIVSHTSSATNQPGTGAQWTTYWRAVSGAYYVGDDPWASGVPYLTATSDGNLLRSDGPNRMGPSRNTSNGVDGLPGTADDVPGTAQIRSYLCQTCHKYELHGQGTDNHKVGCLECHNGHDPAATTDYMLRSGPSNGPVPTRFNRVNSGEQSVTFPTTFNAGNTRTSWADENQGGTAGFCEKCHGDCNSAGMVLAAAEHAAGNQNQCTVCHKHNDPADTYSFNRDASAATCGQCHGFPPYIYSPGDRFPDDGVDGGYAVNNKVAEGGPYDYVLNTTYEKDEAKTGHKVHAGRDVPDSSDAPPGPGILDTSVNDWYFVGASGIDNCRVCHGFDAGSTAGGHRINPTTRPDTFRDVIFYGIATTGGLTPTYNPSTPWTCSNVYCHTNGAPYSGSRPNRDYSRINTTPRWVGNGGTYATGGYSSIYGTASRCAECHGNDVSTMTTGTGTQKSNSVAHLAHLGGATTLNMLKTFNCSVCHVYTASSKDALAVNAMDGRAGQSGGTGGKHVNGLIDVNYDVTALGGDLASSTYAAGTGVCSTYCHNVHAGEPSPNGGQGSPVAADWDLAATDMQCDSCHGGLASDSTGNGGYGPINTKSHQRHILTTGTGPKLACAECHGSGSDAGTHAGHFDGVVNMKVAVNTAAFGSDSISICKECHGYDAEPGEILPVWGSPATTDCATCHAGPFCGETINGKDPIPATYSRTTGHNRPSSSGAYAQTGNPAANFACDACHVLDHAGHWDGTTGDDMMLKTGGGFPAAYTTNADKNNFCGACHGAAGTTTTTNINTHQSKLCVACHNVHGEANIQMIWVTQAAQALNDPSATGKYAGDVFFSNVTNFTAGNSNSYDEDDNVDGGVSESNSDDICATCHTSGAGTLHNNSNNTDNKAPTGHKLGENCFPCHALHTNSTDAFKVGVGTACNDCHGFPPATGAHRNGLSATDPQLYAEVHSNTSSLLLDEDRSDCAFCHPGADLYTYDLSADQAAGGARANHAVSQGVRRAALATAVGYETTNFTCTTACHKSVNGDGEWDDVNGLNCNSCHYAALAPTSAGNVTASNSEAVSAVHNKHFDKNNMTCAQCHTVVDSPGTFTAIRGPLPHVVLPVYTGPGNDGTLIQGRANATLDEATVTRSGMVYSGGAADADGPNNTCTGGITTGCHASGTPDWDVVIPATSAGCVMCHTNTNDVAYNPTSGIHDNSPAGPTITGNAHDGSFDNGSSGTADCVTCHTASPTVSAGNHINGAMNTGSALNMAAIAGYSAGTNDCATTCHSAGTVWRYKWATSAYATNGTECANCHGDYASGWLTGVTPHTNVPTKGSKHNNVGNLSYPCTDCHAIGSAGYKWTSKWDPTGVNSDHGDDRITMNQTGTATFTVNTGRAGCTVACHVWDTAHNFPVTTTTLITETVTGPNPDVLCSGCHGGYAPGGTTVLGYWPDGPTPADKTTNTLGSEDEQGAHVKHMTVLAQAKYGENLTQLLTDNTPGNPGITADAKQKFLCAYCHGTASGNPMDATHGLTSYLPADVTRTYAQWDLTQTTAESGIYTTASDTCATVDCHFNKTTPTAPTNFSWYGGQTGACIMCHVDITNGAVPNSNGGTHVAHTSAATNFGRNITCDDCHKTATETVAWGSPGTPPTNNHINGALTVTGSVTFTYSAGSCGTNDCHEDGKGAEPKTNPYPWGTALANCSICHDASPTTDAHTKHLAAKVTSYMPGSCAACHDSSTTTQITASSHINNVSNAGGGTSQISAAPGNGSCTNTCHLSPQAGDWTGGAAAIACADCHSSTYVGGNNWRGLGNNYMPQYNMHTVTPVTSGKVHTDTGLGTTCQYCHSGVSALGSHIDGVWATDNANNLGGGQGRGMFAGFTDAAIPTCSGSDVDKTGVLCHIDNGVWARKWNANAASNNETRCANCHGYWATGADGTGWRTGVSHAENPTRGSSLTHNDAADGLFGFECYRCHVLGGTGDVYHWANGTNDWVTDAGATTQHGNDKIEMNRTGVTLNDHNISGRSGCTGCHEGAIEVGGNGNSHDYPTSTFAPSVPQLDGAESVASGGGGCDGCHGSGGSYAPNGSRGNVWPDRPGKHAAHIAALTAKGITGTTACNYCHPFSSGSDYVIGEHNDASAPATMPNNTTSYYKRIIGGGNDSNGVLNAGDSTCSTIDCHFNNAVTPHWYADTYLPAQVTLTPVAVDPAVNPRAVKLRWVSPGDDANVAGTTVYRYDMRYSADIQKVNDVSDFSLTDNHVGGLPLAYMQGTTQEVLVDNLTPGTTYYFSLRCQDAAGNWSNPSTVVSAVASGDTVKPYFGGADRAYKGDESQTINVEWSHAEDHTMPVTYRLWMKNLAAGSLVMGDGTLGTDAPLITGIKGYKYQLTAANGVVNDEEYQIGVRACDGVTPTANCDDNTEIILVTPTAVPLVDKTYPLFRANGAAASTYVGLEKGADFTSASTSAIGTGLTFRPAANQTYPSTYFVEGFSLYITNGNTSSTIRATLGYSTGNNFFPFTTPAVTADVTMTSRAKGIKTFKLNATGGVPVAANQRLAVQLTVVSGTVTSVGWGSLGNGGSLTGAERADNVAPQAGATPLAASPSGALVNMNWTAYTDGADAVSDTVHYDLYGSDDNGSTWKYLIATGLSAATTSHSWNTQLSGIALTGPATVAVRIKAGDGYAHTINTVTGIPINNSTDNVAPNAITDLVVKRRAKEGAVMLRWTAPGDDFENNGRAKYYDVRYSTSPINAGNFDSVPDRAYYAPQPTFGGQIQEMEVTGLTPLTNYYFAIKTYDDGTPAKGSAISTAKYVGSDQELGGPRCGMCHTTAPSVVESVGNHRIHGITVADCVKCHGSQVTSFDLDHQDGELRMGWNAGGPQKGIISGNRIYYTNNGLPMGSGGDYILYDDNNNGFGGFGDGSYANVGTVPVDDGTCMNFVAGCHGPAGSGGSYQQPNWISTAKLDCSNCHGNPDRVNDSVYNRPFDSNTSGGTVATDQVKGSPPIDNHGLSTGKYVGLHEKHLNYSFRFAKGDSCNLCHPGRYSDRNDLDGKHADGYIDVKLYKVAAGANAEWTAGAGATPGTCASMSPDSCHPSASSPSWDSSASFDCVQCHGFAGTTPSHVTDTAGGVSSANNGWATDPMAGNCTYCHPGGHPVGDGGGAFLVLANSSQVGINYRSGGIHLKKVIGGRTAMNDASVIDTEAELCWGCHEDNGVSEWGADSSGANTSVRPPNNNDYNFGTLTQTNWIGATWRSAYSTASGYADNRFGYKTGTIKSTHATGPLGTAAITSDRFRTHSETVDPVANLRCSNCHDVHNMNKAPGDNPQNLAPLNGPPYLRGTWLSSPYLEDGAPSSLITYTGVNEYMGVPRGGTANNQIGGYQIDQNNGFPTSGLSLAGTAGLCTLCHGTDIDALDKTQSENLWLGTNGHSNSTLGGTSKVGTAADIFSYAWRNPTAAPPQFTGSFAPTTGPGNPNMGYQNAYLTTSTRVDGFRSAYGGQGWGVLPLVDGSYYAYVDFDWGVSQGTGIDTGYHAFSCSKCHNPHASRLPKLMITNCLDTSKNTWDDNRPSGGLTGASAGGNSLATDNVGRTLADVGSAQNCHRLSPQASTTATNISFPAGGTTIQSVTAIFTAANKYYVGNRIRITGGVNAGKVGTISSMTTTVLTLNNINDANGTSATLTQAAAGPSITLSNIRGGWNKITPW